MYNNNKNVSILYLGLDDLIDPYYNASHYIHISDFKQSVQNTISSYDVVIYESGKSKIIIKNNI